MHKAIAEWIRREQKKKHSPNEVFLSAHKDRLSRSLRSKVVYKASCWDCDDCYIGKTKRRLHFRKTEHFKALTSNSHSSAIAAHMTQTGHRIKWDHFDILATGQFDIHCKIRETLLIRNLKPALNENVGSEKLLLSVLAIYIFPADLTRPVYFRLLSHCHYFPYLVLVLVFKFYCSLGNCYF